MLPGWLRIRVELPIRYDAGVGENLIEVIPAPPIRLPSLTSLRWFAATAVFLRHAKVAPWLGTQGATGVSFFFMLSGFVLAWSMREGQTYRDFAVRRIARIYPAHAVSTAISLPILIGVGVFSASGDMLPGIVSLSLLQSWIPNASYYFGGNLVSWSLSNEVFFYLMFPVLMGPISGIAKPQRLGRLWFLIIVLCAVGVSMPFFVRPQAEVGFGFWLVYVNPAFRLLEFALGMTLARIVKEGLVPHLPFSACATLAFAAYVVAGWVPTYAMYSAVTLVPFAFLLVAAAQSDVKGTTSRVLRSKTLQTLGAWSFAFYLIHSTIIVATRAMTNRYDLSVSPWMVAFGCYLAATIGASALYLGVEVPAERWMRNRFLKAKVPAGV